MSKEAVILLRDKYIDKLEDLFVTTIFFNLFGVIFAS